MNLFGKQEKGDRCQLNGDGESNHCIVFNAGKEGKLATGTDVIITVSKQNNCEPIIQGDILDGDGDRIKVITEEMVKACQKRTSPSAVA